MQVLKVLVLIISLRELSNKLLCFFLHLDIDKIKLNTIQVSVIELKPGD